MPRNGTAKQDKVFKNTQQVGEQSQNNSNSLYSTLTPMYQQEATNPTKTPLYNTLNTASGQSTGGAVAAQKGQTGLARLRTGNRGSSQTLMDDTVRNAMKTNSQNSLNSIMGIQNQGMQGLQGMYGSNVQELLGSMGIGTNIANNQASQPGWFQNMTELIKAGGSVAGSVAAAACPVEGSLYLMADGSEKPVENLVVGDEILGVDDEAQTIEEIQSGMCYAIQIRTENGHLVRNSPTHAFVLPKGGFTVAARSLGKTILTAVGPSKVIALEPAGLARVFNVITDGSHSYRADGVWALGVGEAERHVSMDEWREIGERITYAS